MKKKISTLPFRGTPEQEAELKAVIDANKQDKSSLMAVMQQAQDIYGYLPFEVQNMIAEGMDVPLEKVFGVATFYSQFALSQKGRHHVSVCLGTSRGPERSWRSWKRSSALNRAESRTIFASVWMQPGASERADLLRL